MITKILWLLATLLLADVQLAEAQQTEKIRRIGYISGSDAKASLAQVEGFQEGLRNLGYKEGKTSSFSIVMLKEKWTVSPVL